MQVPEEWDLRGRPINDVIKWPTGGVTRDHAAAVAHNGSVFPTTTTTTTETSLALKSVEWKKMEICGSKCLSPPPLSSEILIRWSHEQPEPVADWPLDGSGWVWPRLSPDADPIGVRPSASARRFGAVKRVAHFGCCTAQFKSNLACSYIVR